MPPPTPRSRKPKPKEITWPSLIPPQVVQEIDPDSVASCPVPSRDQYEILTLNPPQQDVLRLAPDHDVIIMPGPAGTGKSTAGALLAIQGIRSGEFKWINLTKPLVEAEEKLGFLPGELEAKAAPHVDHFRQLINELAFPDEREYMQSRLVVKPLAYMRGSTFKNTISILDEAQNCTLGQFRLFVSRLGKGSKLLINGDIEQIDRKEAYGVLEKAAKRLGRLPRVATVEFDAKYTVRHDLVAPMLAALNDL